jgi:hypothetical protein
MPEIIVYFPKEQEAIDILQKKAAQVHAEAVMGHIHQLPCPNARKMVLLEDIIKGLLEVGGSALCPLPSRDNVPMGEG